MHLDFRINGVWDPERRKWAHNITVPGNALGGGGSADGTIDDMLTSIKTMLEAEHARMVSERDEIRKIQQTVREALHKQHD